VFRISLRRDPPRCAPPGRARVRQVRASVRPRRRGGATAKPFVTHTPRARRARTCISTCLSATRALPEALVVGGFERGPSSRSAHFRQRVPPPCHHPEFQMRELYEAFVTTTRYGPWAEGPVHTGRARGVGTDGRQHRRRILRPSSMPWRRATCASSSSPGTRGRRAPSDPVRRVPPGAAARSKPPIPTERDWAHASSCRDLEKTTKQPPGAGVLHGLPVPRSHHSHACTATIRCSTTFELRVTAALSHGQAFSELNDLGRAAGPLFLAGRKLAGPAATDESHGLSDG